MVTEAIETIGIMGLMGVNLAVQPKFVKRELKKMRENKTNLALYLGSLNLFAMGFMGVLVHILYMFFGLHGLKFAKFLVLVVFFPLYAIYVVWATVANIVKSTKKREL